MFSADRDALRRQFVDAWRKRRAGEPLSPLEAQIADAISLHPEYHALIEERDAVQRDFAPDAGQTNPFLHLSLHLALRDQVATDRPQGIATLFGELAQTLGQRHAAEHVLLERLGEAIWRAQRDGQPPDEQAYLRALKEDLRRAKG